MNRRKKIIALFRVLGVAFGLGCSICTYAAETDDTSTTAETTQQEEVTISVKLKEFQDKWMTPLVSGALGLLGSFLGYFLYKRKYRVIMAVMNSGIKMTEEQRKEANADLIATKELYENAKEDFEQKRKDYEQVITLARNEIEELKQYRLENVQFKELIGLLIASSPELARNGYAQKILKLLDEGEKIYQIVTETEAEEVGDTNGTNN